MSLGRHVVVVGAGGNIGSHLVPHLARAREVDVLTLVDRDTYTESNVAGQNITARDVGRKKALVQAARARSITPSLRVEAVAAAVEDVPLGRLRGDLLLSCLDSRAARLAVNSRAWRLGIPWIDAGVDGGGLLARLDVYVPGAANPCLECSWDEGDYEDLDQEYTCAGEPREPAPTGASSALGGLAAALQAIECQTILAEPGAAERRQVLLDARHHRHFVTRFRRHSACRLSDHSVWAIRPVRARARELSLGELAAAAPGSATMRIEGRSFLTRRFCSACGYSRAGVRAQPRSPAPSSRCPRCRRPIAPRGLDRAGHLDIEGLPPRARRRSVASLGIRDGDVVSLGRDGHETHFEIGSDR